MGVYLYASCSFPVPCLTITFLVPLVVTARLVIIPPYSGTTTTSERSRSPSFASDDEFDFAYHNEAFEMVERGEITDSMSVAAILKIKLLLTTAALEFSNEAK